METNFVSSHQWMQSVLSGQVQTNTGTSLNTVYLKHVLIDPAFIWTYLFAFGSNDQATILSETLVKGLKKKSNSSLFSVLTYVFCNVFLILTFTSKVTGLSLRKMSGGRWLCLLPETQSMIGIHDEWAEKLACPTGKSTCPGRGFCRALSMSDIFGGLFSQRGGSYCNIGIECYSKCHNNSNILFCSVF